MRQNYRFQLLAPPQTRSGSAFGRSKTDEQLYRQRLASVQSLRGRVYLKDGAIQPCELDDHGRFPMRGDEQSWHFLLIDENEETIGCARYLVHPHTVRFESLRISHSPVARHRHWGARLRQAVEADLARAREENFSYVEIGGWALSKEWRGTRAALEILVASYALAQLWGGSLGSCMATVRHHSSSILRRIGGSSFEINGERVPAYDDPYYGCTMELLRFDSRSPTQRFIPLINQLKARVASTLTIRRARTQPWRSPVGQLGAKHVGMMQMMPAYR
jgi:predicted GNAT family N-acyltransferase